MAKLSNRHPTLTKHESSWMFFQESYVGGPEYLTSKNIFRHSRENQKDYETRLKRAVYLNYCKPPIKTYTSFVYGSENRIARVNVAEDQDWTDFTTDVDLKGNGMDDFMKGVSNMSQTFGMVLIGVDRPMRELGEEIISMAQAKAAGDRPYLVMWTPLQIQDFSLDRFGQLNWIRVKETQRLDSDPFAEEYKDKTVFRTFTREEWIVSDPKTGDQIARGAHNLGVVPMVPVYFERHPFEEFIGLGQLQDVARINRLMINTVSAMDEFINKQAFPFLAEEDRATTPSGAGDEDDVVGAGNVYTVPMEGQFPQYISPSTEPAGYLKEVVMDVYKREILRQFHLEHRELMESQSGRAKEFDFHETNDTLVHFARNLEQAETKVAGIWGLWERKPDMTERVTIDYPDDFNIEALEQALEESLDIRKLYGDMSPTVVSENLKHLSTRILPKIAEDIQQVIAGELDESAAVASQVATIETEMREIQEAA